MAIIETSGQAWSQLDQQRQNLRSAAGEKWSNFCYNAAGISLAGGTDEVMRNILAEQVLGLPQEPRADKGIAFQDIPTGPS